MKKIYILFGILFLSISAHSQDSKSAPCSDTLFSIPFVETWDSGFSAHSWTFPYTQGNWTILPGEGNPAPGAAFTGLPSTSNYIHDMVSVV